MSGAGTEGSPQGRLGRSRDTWALANQEYLTAALAELSARLVGDVPVEPAAARLADAGARLPPAAPPALDQLCALFALTPFERDIVLLCAGVELDGAFAARLSTLPGASSSGRPSFGLAMAALAGQAHWSALAPSAPLRFWRIVEPAGRADEPLTSAPLRIDERVLHYLAGIGGTDERLAGIVRPVPVRASGLGGTAGLVRSHARTADHIEQLWASQPPEVRWPVALLCGAQAAARRSVAAAVADGLGMRLHVLDAADIPGAAGERETLARLWEREAALSDSALLVEVGDTATEPERRRALAAFLSRTSGGVLVSADNPPALAAVDAAVVVRFDLPAPRADEQATLWRGALGAETTVILDGHLGRLAAQFRVDGQTLERAAAAARIMIPPVGDPDAATDPAGGTAAGATAAGGTTTGGTTAGGAAERLIDALWDACLVQARPRLDDLAGRIDSRVGWDDIVLPDGERETLRLIAAQVRGRTRVYEEWGFAVPSSRGLGVSALFAGPSGTGKTMAAEVLAGALRLDLYRVDLATVVSKYIGETEKNLRRIFDAAEYGGVVLLFDEADALFGRRSEVRDSHDRYANIEVSYLLQRMEEYRGLAILTTNMKAAIDPAFLRRLRFVVTFPFPDAAERESIWRRTFPPAVPVADLDFSLLAQLNVSGGTIRNIALAASFLAADVGEPVGMGFVRRAAVREYAKLEQALTGVELAGWPPVAMVAG